MRHVFCSELYLGTVRLFTESVPDPKNVSELEPPAGHMACTCSTVYIGDTIIMDVHNYRYGHSSPGITFMHHTNNEIELMMMRMVVPDPNLTHLVYEEVSEMQ